MAVFIAGFVFAHYRGKVENNLKAHMKLTRQILLEPEKLTDQGLRYRRLCFMYFLLFVLLLVGVPIVAALFK